MDTESKVPADPSSAAPEPAPPSRGLLGLWLAVLLVWLAVALPLALGQRTFYLRDVFSNHLPHKAFGAEQLREGRIPAFEPSWGLGQPYRGNPSLLAFYPDNLLYLVLPFWSAFNLHFALHWLLALLAMHRLARELGQGPAAAWLAGVTYAGSGWFLSALTFYNIVTVVAWWPLVIAGVVRGGRAGIGFGGLACGMALLGGEPITAVLALVPLLLAVVPRRGWRAGLRDALATGGLGLLIALPQIVATARILGVSFRGAHGNPTSVITSYTLAPERLLELLVPFPFGWPWYQGRFGVWYQELASTVPYYFCLYFGVIGLWLALAAGRRHRGWALLAAGSLLLAWAGGAHGELFATLTLGLFRFPERFLVWLALALPLLAGWGLERVVASGRWSRGALAGAVTAALLGVGVALARPGLVAHLRRVFAGFDPVEGPAGIAATQSALLAAALWAAALLLVLGAWAARAGRPRLLAGCQLLALLQLFPLVQTDATASYRRPSLWERRLGAGAEVLNTQLLLHPWQPEVRYPEVRGPRWQQQRLQAADLHPTPGVLHGFSYPLAPNLEGLASAYSTFVEVNLARAGWDARLRWLRVLGVQALVWHGTELDHPDLEPVDHLLRGGVSSRLYRVRAPAPAVWWPRAVVAAASPVAAWRAVSEGEEPVQAVAVPRAVAHQGGGTVRLLAATPDRLELEVAGEGGLAVVRRAWQPQLVARLASGERLATLPVDLLLLGVEVPPGRHRVVVAASALPEQLAGAVALLALAGALWLWRRG